MSEPGLGASAEGLLAEAFEHAPVGFALFDTQLRYVRVNAELVRMSGLSARALIGRMVAEVLPGLPPEATWTLREVLRSGLPLRDVELCGEVPASAGQRRTWLASQYPLRRGERVVGVARVLSDVTERKRAEAAQREQAELLALADETVIVRRPDGTITAWNEAAQAMYGYLAAEATGRNIHELLRTRFPSSLEAVHRALLNEGRWQGELRHLCRDGGEIDVLSRQALQRDAQGVPKAILEINWDITARVRAQRELQQLNDTLERRVAERTAELSELNEELEAFTYTVAHDLRTPLRSMHGFAEAVREDHADRLDAEGQAMLRRIAENADRMDALIRDLLEYSRLSRSELRSQPVRLEDVTAAALRQLQAELTAGGAVVRVEGPLPVVMGHPATLTQVVLNLLTNAVKFIAPGVKPRVRVRAERRADRIRVEITDNGIGVAGRHRERIWRVFERLHTTDEYPGTGVGLAIVRKGLERMNGSFGVQAAGGGSCFWFELPAVADLAEADG